MDIFDDKYLLPSTLVQLTIFGNFCFSKYDKLLCQKQLRE